MKALDNVRKKKWFKKIMKILKIAWIGAHQKQDTGDYGSCVQTLSINQSIKLYFMTVNT